MKLPIMKFKENKILVDTSGVFFFLKNYIPKQLKLIKYATKRCCSLVSYTLHVVYGFNEKKSSLSFIRYQSGVIYLQSKKTYFLNKYRFYIRVKNGIRTGLLLRNKLFKLLFKYI